MSNNNEQQDRKTNHKWIALGLSIIPGFGQFYNKQWLKGGIYFTVIFSFLIAFWDFLNMGFWGLFTLGTELPRDNSVFLLAEGILAVIVSFFGLVIYYMNLRDAYLNGQKRDENKPLDSLMKQYQNVKGKGYPYLISGPALFILIFTVIFPVLFSFALAFTNYSLHNSPPASLVNWVGLGTFKNIFTVDIWRITFLRVFSWTIVWTIFASTLQVTIGVLLAVLVNQKDLKFKKLIRSVLILPWAVPAFVTILIFGGLFNDSFGAINTTILPMLGIEPIPWMTNVMWTRVALILIQGWLGFPYIFIVTTGVLQSIPDDLYEAATIDGANIFNRFKSITMPLILFSISPIIITQYTFNFNNFNLIYLFNMGGPAVPGSTAGGTDILVSWIYKLTLQSNQYALAAALTILLSLFVIPIAVWQFRRTKAFKGEV